MTECEIIENYKSNDYYEETYPFQCKNTIYRKNTYRKNTFMRPVYIIKDNNIRQ